MSIAFQYHDAISARLRDSGQSLARQHQALAVLWTITRHLSWHRCASICWNASALSGE